VQLKEFRADEVIVMDGDHLRYVYEIKEGTIKLQWKWDSWKEETLEKPMMIGIWNLINDTAVSFIVIGETKGKVAMVNRDDLFSDVIQIREKVWKSLAFFYQMIINQKFLGIVMSPEESLYSAFEAFVFWGEKNKALDIYNQAIDFFEDSKKIDSMLGVIMDLTSGKLEIEMSESEAVAYDDLLSRSTSSDPLQNLVVLKTFEEKFPSSKNLGEVRARCVEEYDRLNDHYQANRYLRKLIYFHSQEEAGQQALFSMIGRQKSEGDPEWLENAIRFVLTYPDSPFLSMVRHFLEGSS